MKLRLPILVTLFHLVQGCSPLASDGVVDALDNRMVQGCYGSEGLPSINVTENDIRTDVRVIFQNYRFVTHGRDAREIIIGKPRILLEKLQKISNDRIYDFGKIVDNNGVTSLRVVRAAGDIALEIVSNPDYKLHRYKKIPC